MTIWRKIAGRGSPGDINWGASGRPRATLEKELRELRKHIGERVVLSGGGGPGYSIGRLQGAEIVEQGYLRGKPGLKVYLTNLKGDMRGDFEPWIDSWQISVVD